MSTVTLALRITPVAHQKTVTQPLMLPNSRYPLRHAFLSTRGYACHCHALVAVSTSVKSAIHQIMELQAIANRPRALAGQALCRLVLMRLTLANHSPRS